MVRVREQERMGESERGWERVRERERERGVVKLKQELHETDY
jgi:hypothetical protein